MTEREPVQIWKTVEALMQYVWRHRLWPHTAFVTSDGRRVSVIDPGTANTGDGPDFFNAKIRIDGEMWAGNIEMHVRASDWFRHGHDGDPAYDNVILHVVAYDDREVRRRSDDRIIPQVTMRCDAGFSEKYSALVMNPANELACAPHLMSLPAVVRADWLTSLAFERLQRKSDDILERLRTNGGDWNVTVYQTLARGLGFGSNADAMERLARAVPLRILLSKGDSHSTVEALLLGRAGMLHTPARDGYESMLNDEYAFYCHKFPILASGEPIQWRNRVRPQNAPLRRVIALAGLVCDGFAACSRIFTVENVDDAVRVLGCEATPYWSTHTAPGRPGTMSQALLSRSSVELLVINVVVPLKYAYGEYTGDDAMMAAAVDLLTMVKAESNAIVTLFAGAGLECHDALTSQALIQLRTAYCQTRKCLFCRFGHRLLSRAVPAR